MLKNFEGDNTTTSERLLDLDESALHDAAAFFRTLTPSDTVNAALRQVASRHKRTQALEKLAEMGTAGDFDILLDKRNYRR